MTGAARAATSTLREILDLLRDGAQLVLAVRTERVLARGLGSDAAEDDAVQQGVPAQAVVAMDAASHLARGVQARDRLAALRVQHRGVDVHLQAAHAVVDDGGDDGDVERLGLHGGAWDDVVVELLAGARLAAGLVPRLAGRVRGPRAAVGVLLGLLRRLVVQLGRLLEHRHRDPHVLGEGLAVLVELHDAAASVMLAVPADLVGGRLVQAEAEGRLVLPHLAGDVVPAAQLVREALAVGVEHQPAHAPQRLCGQELDLGVGVVRLHQPGGVHLDPLQVDGPRADCLAHLDTVAGAMLAVGGRQMEQVGAVLRQQRVRGEVGAEAAAGQDHGAELLEILTVLGVDQAHYGELAPRRVGQQLVGAGFGDDAGTVRLLCNLLKHLDQGVGNGHAGKALRATVSARRRVATEARHKRQIQVELVDEPVHVRATVVAENLGELWALGPALESVVGK
mmetsp:Transcript_108466/g.282956  ORF Transcript_108466/g.282956 Transcript_108466/m.282956 type:complete len:452 (-) Transcript_108466:70-1425(-)